VRLANWAGNYTYTASTIHHPASIERVQELIAGAEKVRVVGSRHCFNDIADSSELISLADLPPDVIVDRDAQTISFTAGTSYGTLAQALQELGLALDNLPSLPHISVAGAVATATHGSGDRNPNLATAVAGM